MLLRDRWSGALETRHFTLFFLNSSRSLLFFFFFLLISIFCCNSTLTRYLLCACFSTVLVEWNIKWKHELIDKLMDNSYFLFPLENLGIWLVELMSPYIPNFDIELVSWFYLNGWIPKTPWAHHDSDSRIIWS